MQVTLGGEPLGEGVQYQIQGEGGYQYTDENGLIRLEAGQTAMLPVLSGMTYEVVETNQYGQPLESSEEWGIAYSNAEGTTPDPNEHVTAVVTNTFPVLEGDLSITKTVARTDGVAPSGSGFQFEITLSDGKVPATGVTGTFDYTVGDGTDGKITFNNGVMTSITGTAAHSETIVGEDGQTSTTKYYVKLDHNQTITIQALPGGTVATIKEVNYSGYAPAWKDTKDTTSDTTSDIHTNAGDTVTTEGVSAEDPIEVTCTNTTGAVLPSTGGPGVANILTLGTLLTLGAGAVLLLQRRRKEGDAC